MEYRPASASWKARKSGSEFAGVDMPGLFIGT
jgi:hypothetical protein